MFKSYKWQGLGMGWKSPQALILRAPLCGANNDVAFDKWDRKAKKERWKNTNINTDKDADTNTNTNVRFDKMGQESEEGELGKYKYKKIQIQIQNYTALFWHIMYLKQSVGKSHLCPCLRNLMKFW